MAHKLFPQSIFGIATESEEEWPERYTPFRCPSLKNKATGKPGSPQNLQDDDMPPFSTFSLEAKRYSDYMRAFYDSKSSHTQMITDGKKSSASVFNVPVILSGSPTIRSHYLCRSATDWWQDGSPAPPVTPIPSPPPRYELEVEEKQPNQANDKLVWVDLLNQWTLKENLDKPYLTFVKNPPREERVVTSTKPLIPKETCNKTCERHELHMDKMVDNLNIPFSEMRKLLNMSYTFRGFKKKDEEDKPTHVRKVHSTPPYPYTPSSIEKREDELQNMQLEALHPVPSRSLEHLCSRQHHAHWDDDEEFESVTPVPVSSLDQFFFPQINGEGPRQIPIIQADDHEEKRKESYVQKKNEPSVNLLSLVQSPIKQKQKSIQDIGSVENEGIKEADGSSVQLSSLSLVPQPSSASSLAPVESGMSQCSVEEENESSPKKGMRWIKTKKKIMDLDRRRRNPIGSKKDSEQSGEIQEKDQFGESHDEDQLSQEEEDVEGEQSGTVKKAREIVKKERLQRSKGGGTEKEVTPTQVGPPTQTKKTGDWIFGEEDLSTEEKPKKTKVEVPSNLPTRKEETKVETKEIKTEQKKTQNERKLLNAPNTVVVSQKKKRPPPVNQSYNDDFEKLEKAEERRKKQQEALKRHRLKKVTMQDDDDYLEIPRFEDNGFLAKYCILNRTNMEMYKRAFDAVDQNRKGWLSGRDAMIALKGINSKLTETAEFYLYRILELIGFKVTDGADFKLFSVLAALSVKLSSLDEWMKTIIDKMDFKALDMKMFACKKLWECNVDKSTNKISLDQLCIELRAGGISLKHEREVREKLSHLEALDLLDFLTYIPLFVLIHMSVVKNPLNDTRDI